jgi:hypothetical protein
MDTTPHEAVRGDLGLQLLSSCAARSTRAGLRRVLFLAEFTDPGGLDVAPAPFHPFARPGGTFLYRILWQFLFFFHFLMSFLGSSCACTNQRRQWRVGADVGSVRQMRRVGTRGITTCTAWSRAAVGAMTTNMPSTSGARRSTPSLWSRRRSRSSRSPASSSSSSSPARSPGAPLGSTFASHVCGGPGRRVRDAELMALAGLMFAFAFLLPLLGPSRAPGADPSALCMVAAILRFAVYPLYVISYAHHAVADRVKVCLLDARVHGRRAYGPQECIVC